MIIRVPALTDLHQCSIKHRVAVNTNNLVNLEASPFALLPLSTSLTPWENFLWSPDMLNPEKVRCFFESFRGGGKLQPVLEPEVSGG